MIINSSFMYFFSFRTVLLLFLFSTSILVVSVSSDEFHQQQQQQLQNKQFLGGRRSLFEIDEFEQPQSQKPKKKSTSSSSSSSSSTKNQTKLIKPSLSTKPKNQTKLIKTNISSKNQTIKLQKLKSSNSTKPTLTNSSKSDLKKLNSPTSKPLKTSDPLKNKTKIPTKQTQTLLEKKETTKPKPKPKQEKQIPKQKQKQPSWLEDEDDDLVSEFRDLPTKFQRTLLPDLERISTTSKAYLDKYNKEITKGFKPFVGHKYASTIASICSFLFILVPLVLVSLIFNRIKAYFSIQKILIFIQVYLAIYFSILCLSALVTGLEPLKFFYATSQSTYVCLQVLQTLGYVLYLLLLLMYLILVFSTDCGLGSRMLGLAQTFVGYAVGLHYYVAVFHRVVLHQPPKTNWKIHGVYATCFLVICLFATAERRKKAYLEEGGEEGKKS
ncbi:uncharacterized protein LOC116120816 [Pistacia vera]|uniref:uncharacterized protein LOC116120816 n=1 Tax=Pistacia vera TaxID=55513 RepID=UPI001262E554|nr:uncharacterized protein LOC116120816 [Pistacia vera]